MVQVKLYEYYSFGFNYNILLRAAGGKSNLDCYTDLKKYLAFLDKVDLKVTKSSVGLNKLTPEIEKLAKLAKSKKTKNVNINPAFWDNIINRLKKIDAALDAELNTKIAFLLDEKRFSNEILTTRMGHLFSKETFTKLPSIALFDFEESGRCLAFDRYTACTFHSLRGTEDVLKLYYELILGTKATDKDTWGTYETSILNAITSKTILPELDEQLIINITSLRKFYRNKTQHPQLTYSSDEAQDLLSLCIKTVNELFADLKKRKLIYL